MGVGDVVFFAVVSSSCSAEGRAERLGTALLGARPIETGTKWLLFTVDLLCRGSRRGHVRHDEAGKAARAFGSGKESVRETAREKGRVRKGVGEV